MAITVRLGNRSQETSKLASIGEDTSVKVSRIVYQGLRSLVQNKHILDDYNNGLIPKELVALYEDFSKINNGETVDIEIQKLDEYLGSLGVNQDYVYFKDTIYIEPWISASSQFFSRNVIDDSTGTTNNVIDRNTGYNVIHNTEK